MVLYACWFNVIILRHSISVVSFKVPLGWTNLHVHDPRSLQNVTKRCFGCQVTPGYTSPLQEAFRPPHVGPEVDGELSPSHKGRAL